MKPSPKNHSPHQRGSDTKNSGKSTQMVEKSRGVDTNSPLDHVKDDKLWTLFLEYIAIHKWVKRNLIKGPKCEHCGSTERKIQWANKSHEYRKEETDWLQLCRPCHAEYDRGKKNKFSEALRKYKKNTLEYDRAYNNRNREKKRQWSREWKRKQRKTNPLFREKHKAQCKDYRLRKRLAQLDEAIQEGRK